MRYRLVVPISHNLLKKINKKINKNNRKNDKIETINKILIKINE